MTPEFSLLFLSCDLVGSTQFKQTNEDWPRQFLNFYRQFPQLLADVAKDSSRGVQFEMWKAVGDELIFTCRVQHERDVLEAVRVWIKAMDRYEAGPLQDVKLGTKGSAFIATFPGPDARVTIPRDPTTERSDLDPLVLNAQALDEDDDSKFLYDYLGPSIDTGFRIASACTQRYFTMSVEVAWAYGAGTQAQSENEPANFVYLGPRAFKGVWDGREYPLIALDRQHDDAVHAATRALLPATSFTDILKLCKACSESGNWPSRAYLPASGFAVFTKSRQSDPVRPPVASPDGIETAVDDGGPVLPNHPPLG